MKDKISIFLCQLAGNVLAFGLAPGVGELLHARTTI